ncbi:stage II sporulation protein P [Metasolibacillus sp. FSL H7-0170]|uniref:stage II sporulation protein P n=1 Tax=Metasolibacillus TaxID=2703677 RepID=UPI0007957E63|nr:stage II sporulation protein P [Metasolibacillus fluoroglycofenilyticus]KYG88835.1 stage II sporulation protein P [[Bacillus] sp. KCTC 13219]
MKVMQRFFLLLFVLFLLPIIMGQLPFPNNHVAIKETESESVPEKKVVYAAATTINPSPVNATPKPLEILFVYTHSHEAYKPVVESKTGMQAVYDEQTNIFTMQQAMLNHFQLNNLQGTVLDVDVMNVMKQQGADFHQAYRVVRPYIQEELATNLYDLVIDFHRDAVGRKVTTLETPEMNFAKVAFVVGLDHPGYEGNLTYAEALHTAMNNIVPGISRGVMKKSGVGVDGVYNQDLFHKMLLVELGGIDNTEEEILRTVAVLAQAIAKINANEKI